MKKKTNLKKKLLTFGLISALTLQGGVMAFAGNCGSCCATNEDHEVTSNTQRTNALRILEEERNRLQRILDELAVEFFYALGQYEENLRLNERSNPVCYREVKWGFVEDYGLYTFPTDCYGYKERANWWFGEKERLLKQRMRIFDQFRILCNDLFEINYQH